MSSEKFVEILKKDIFAKNVLLGIKLFRASRNQYDEYLSLDEAKKELGALVHISSRALADWHSAKNQPSKIKFTNLMNFFITIITLEHWNDKSPTRFTWMKDLFDSTDYWSDSYTKTWLKDQLLTTPRNAADIEKWIKIIFADIPEDLLYNLAWDEFYKSNFESASDFITRYLNIVRNHNDLPNEAKGLVLRSLINSFTILDDPSIFKNLQTAITIYQRLDNIKGQAEALRVLGIFYENKGNREESLETYQKAYKLCLLVSDNASLLCLLYGHLGNEYVYIGQEFGKEGNTQAATENYLKAKNYYQTGLKISIDLNNLRFQSVQYGNLANLFDDLEEYDEAIFHYGQASSLAKAIGDKRNQGIHQNNLGEVYYQRALKTGDLKLFDKALEAFQLAFEIAEDINDKEGIVIALTNQAEVLITLGQCAAAEANIEKAEQYNQNLNNAYFNQLFQDLWEIWNKHCGSNQADL